MRLVIVRIEDVRDLRLRQWLGFVAVMRVKYSLGDLLAQTCRAIAHPEPWRAVRGGGAVKKMLAIPRVNVWRRDVGLRRV